ncbi:hypothetical protein VD0002_g7451 [Verticillium dahliae]|uniref:Regulator of phospholipase D SRF1 n=2 Tax=Verticillium dahliae TaxID=27337 RepID=G2XG35_VERDV|nr:uncharacterized protein VDAG_09014 [Verticillium dahliae VdLs.17]KAF3343275.1 Vacuolar protein sorting-associated protein 4 [Verticillium dahliae VDG2]KAF3360925.1 hypothetical protein VdG1_04790 [Verticillium dahliae VDG1]PNH36510.1 hypothetical protein BJF96_g127 [Verticillium dahliae]EGY18854.1 hypothetical protein VDAG_09014 [Verticillium dahliae VdLs.17]PNH44281.1 hypothetical protein VD0004_g3389 [Verticillium dahliae]
MDSSSATAAGPSSSPDFRAVSVGTSNATLNHSQAARQRPPRSLPPWIDSYESENGPLTDDQMRLLRPPQRSVLPQHNYDPSETERRISKDGFVDWAQDPLSLQRSPPNRRLTVQKLLRGRRGQQGRKWDHLRSAEPVVVAAYAPPAPGNTGGAAAVWRHYVQSTVYGRAQGEDSEVVDPEMLDKLQPDFNRPFDNPLHPHESRSSRRRKRTRTVGERIWRAILRHPLVPLVFRLTVMITSLMSLAIATRIFVHENAQDRSSAERTQSVVAVVVDTVAVPYIAYMLWDEYTGKPLGLRPATQKIALILLDLFFIILKSVSTALAFESLVYHNDRGDAKVAQLSKALSAFVFVGLVSWTFNFMVNIFRTVARLGTNEG